VDSSFLLKMAKEVLNNKVIAVTAVSPLQPGHEKTFVSIIARRLGIKHITINPDTLSNKEVRNNTKKRCYYCKLILMRKIREIANQYGYVAIEATSRTDLRNHRPGIKALKRLGITSPLAEAGFEKKDIRRAARRLGLPNWNAPSAACLASRIPYGQEISKERLRRIGKAENYLRRLRFTQIRVRDHYPIARVEIDPREFKKILRQHRKIVRYFNRLGYRFVTLDLAGYRSGSFDR
jgi:uncharacterized protein